MATYGKRKNGWAAEVCIKGKRRSKTFRTKAEAKFWAAGMETELRLMDEGISPHHTLGDVFERYAEEVSETKRGAHWEIIRLKKFCRDEFACIKLIDLKREHLERWIQQRLKSIKPSSVNRELNLISHCMTQARRWRLMKHNPMADLKRPRNPPARDRRITDSEIELLMVALGYDENVEIVLQRQKVAVAFLLAIETAMRAGEICSLTIDNINFSDRTAYLPMTKNGLPRYVPLSKRAIELIRRLEPVKTVFGLTSSTLSAIFRKAVISAGIANLTFHDTRHEAITRLARKLDVLDLARAVGHSDIKQLMTYYNKSAADLATQL